MRSYVSITGLAYPAVINSNGTGKGYVLFNHHHPASDLQTP